MTLSGRLPANRGSGRIKSTGPNQRVKQILHRKQKKIAPNGRLPTTKRIPPEPLTGPADTGRPALAIMLAQYAFTDNG